MAGTGVTHSGSDAWLMWGARETWSALPKGMAGRGGAALRNVREQREDVDLTAHGRPRRQDTRGTEVPTTNTDRITACPPR